MTVNTKVVDTRVVNTKIVKALMGFNEMTVADLAEVLGLNPAYVRGKLNKGSYGKTRKGPTFNDSDVEKMAAYFKYKTEVFYLDDAELVFDVNFFDTISANCGNKE